MGKCKEKMIRLIRSPATIVLFLTWLLYAAYYLNRLNYSPVIPLIKADLNISNAGAGVRPLLTVQYSGVPQPPQQAADIPTLSQWGLMVMAAWLLVAAVRRLRRA